MFCGSEDTYAPVTNSAPGTKKDSFVSVVAVPVWKYVPLI